MQLRSVPGSNETPASRNVSMRSQKTHPIVLSKRNSDIHKVDKYYIGLLHQIPPPKEVQDKWDRDIRPNLEQHLCQATRMLSKSLRDEEVITEPVLCMAGKRLSSISLLSESSIVIPADHVALNPMIWVYCGSRKCKSKVTGVTSTLSYVKHFERAFTMRPLHASLQAPWPAGSGSLSSFGHNEQSPVEVSLDIEVPKTRPCRISGLKARFTIVNELTTVERYCTIGGLINVEHKLYALTTAHPLLNSIYEHAASMSTPNHDTSTDDSDETSSDSDQSDMDRLVARADAKSSLPAAVAGNWITVRRPTALSYLGRAASDGNYDLPRSISTVSDFALIEIENSLEFIDAGRLECLSSDHVLNTDLSSGEVSILVNNDATSVRGYLLDASASIILRGEIIRTRKVQMKCPGKRGWSGSWVVRNNKLCGMVYAAYDYAPYLHMLPIEDIFHGIRELLNATHVGVADLSMVQRVLVAAPEVFVGASGNVRSRKGRNQRLPVAALNTLQTWLDEHRDNPYPSIEEKRRLAENCGITDKQVTTWFTNARARQLTMPAASSEDDSGSESVYTSAVQSSTTANTDLTSWSEEQMYNRSADFLSLSNIQSSVKSQSSRRGKKKQYRRERQPSIDEVMIPDTTDRNKMMAAPILPEMTLDSSDTTGGEEMWQCTFCHRRLVPKSWRRHEETQHRPRKKWVCMLHGPRVSLHHETSTDSMASVCAFCMVKNPSGDHFLCNHRISECAKKSLSDRTFFRPDHLRQHIKNFHSATLFDVVQMRWRVAADEEGGDGAGWTCGFCAAHLNTWDKRETHIATHFQEGMTMDQWVEGGGVERVELQQSRQGKAYPRADFATSRPSSVKTRSPHTQAQAPPLTTTSKGSLDTMTKDVLHEWYSDSFMSYTGSMYNDTSSLLPMDSNAIPDYVSVLSSGGREVYGENETNDHEA